MSRLHMPGHKGKPLLGCEPLDITEISGADELYAPSGIIAESERNAAALFGAGRTLYSTEGSSHCIRAMLYLAMPRTGERPLILAARNVHKSFISACALLDIDVEWIFGGGLCSCTVSPDELDRRLKGMQSLPFAVYVTSPDYLGNISDIEGLGAVCRRYGLPLLVDNAHGAYLRFLPVPQHPIGLGADMCCDSGHKTLPVLTGGAYLHISKSACADYISGAESAMALFGSTSPSYLILQSLDICNRCISDGYPRRIAECADKIAVLRKRLSDAGCSVCGSEPLKLVIDTASMGRNGSETADELRKNSVECEFSDLSHVVLMFTPENPDVDYDRVFEALSRAAKSKRPSLPVPVVHGHKPKSVMSIRRAMFAAHERIPAVSADGRVCGAPAVSCPPEIPIIVSGEIITAGEIELMRRYGIDEVEVVAEK